MFHKSKGIVLQTVKYGETSAIAKIFTEHHGLLSFMVYGFRSTKSSRKASMLQPGTLLEIDYIHQANKSLHQIKDLKRAYAYRNLPFDIRRSSVMLFLIELLSKSIHENQVNEDEFEFVYNKLLTLDLMPEPDPYFHLEFMVQLTNYLGFLPENNYSSQLPYFDIRNGCFSSKPDSGLYDFSGEESVLLSDLLNDVKSELKFSKQVRNRFAEKFLRYYAYHIEGFGEINTLKIFEDVFA